MTEPLRHVLIELLWFVPAQQREAYRRRLGSAIQEHGIQNGLGIAWIAQTVHQAHHFDQSEGFRECSQSVCAAAKDLVDSNSEWARSLLKEERDD